MKPLLRQGLSEQEYYGDLVFKLKKNASSTDMCYQFRNVIIRCKHVGYNLKVIRQSVCLVINPFADNDFTSVFNCTPVGRASDSIIGPF